MSVIENAYAKINLSLDVTGKLENGYHLVKMIMASISLKDILHFELSENPGIHLMMDAGSVQSDNELSLGDDNLIVKAAKAILADEIINRKEGCPKSSEIGIDILLEKNIPMAAGMAGGSADAAATLRGINRLLGLNLSLQELCDIGVRLGADVPFCVRQGCFLSEGIGEVLTPLSKLSDMVNTPYIAIIKPPIDVSTKFVYEHLDNEGIQQHPDVDGQVEAIKNGDLVGITDRMRNVLRDVTIPKYPIVLELEDFLKEHGAMNAMMSGSGPTVFGIFEDDKSCEEAIKNARIKYPDMFIDSASFVDGL